MSLSYTQGIHQAFPEPSRSTTVIGKQETVLGCGQRAAYFGSR